MHNANKTGKNIQNWAKYNRENKAQYDGLQQRYKSGDIQNQKEIHANWAAHLESRELALQNGWHTID